MQDQLATDWSKYYSRIPVTAHVTRRCMKATVLRTLQRFVSLPQPSILEIGGANSPHIENVMKWKNISRYDIVDMNAYGLDLARRRWARDSRVHCFQQSVLDLSPPQQYDLVFSLGLIEHFNQQDTARAVLSHFNAVRPGGIVLITFPTPTWLYRACRFLLEITGTWNFPDERPLKRQEVLSTALTRGSLLYRKTLWPIILTQELLVMKSK